MLEEFKKKTSRIIEVFKTEVSGIRTNRPHAGILENVKVLYYNESVPLKSMCAISIAPPREIILQVYDASVVSGVAHAIESEGKGLSTRIEGNIIRVFLPELSGERREELVKYLGKIAENSRIELRHARDESMKSIERKFHEGELREDEKFKTKETIQKEVDRVNDEIEKIVGLKTKEIQE